MIIKILKTKRGLPALWESGGGASNTGSAQIICSRDGSPKKPLYIRGAGHLACAEHALFVVCMNDLIIHANHHRGDFTITVASLGRIFRLGDCELRRLPQPWSDNDPTRVCEICGERTDGNGVHEPRSEEGLNTFVAGCSPSVTFSQGEWDETPLVKWMAAIEAAKAKALCYHCREPHYMLK